MKRRFTWPRLILCSILLLLFAAWYVPRISAERYREPIHAALESALGRKVQIGGRVRFQLLPLPGFTVEYVSIGEDPEIGQEPTAYVTTLRARPRLSALFGGALEFASVDLEDTSINLTRVDRPARGVQWNFSSLMRPKLLAAFPSVHLVGGRVNFKFGDTKSIFYLLHTDVDLWPPSKADRPWTIHIHAEPARTDRPARGFGSFAANGEWHQRDGAIVLNVKLEKSELGDMVTLFQGREAGLHGHIWGDAHLAGPLNRVGLAGRVMVDDIHGWNQTPPGGSAWPLAVGGAIDVPGQVMDVRVTTQGRQSPLDIRYRVADYLGHPYWGVTAIFSQLPLSPLVGIARNMGWAIPADLTLDGMAQGAAGFSMPNGTPRMNGEVRIANSVLAAAGTPTLRIPDAELRFADSAITLLPAAVLNDANETATLEGSYDVASQSLSASLSTENMAIASLRRQISVAGVPLLNQAASGSWSGSLRYGAGESSGAAGWSGEVSIRNTDIPFEGFARPLHVVSADAIVDGMSVVMKRLSFTMGEIEGQGEYRYDPAAVRPHHFRVTAGKVSAAEIEKLLLPTLHRGNFLNYAFNLGSVPEPDWMRRMGADGTILVSAFDVAGEQFSKIRTRILWDGDVVRFAGLQAQSGKGAFAGSATVNLAERQPQYQVSGKLAGLAWRAGSMNAEGVLETSGTGSDLLANMSAKGSFHAKDIDLTPLDTWDTINGCFEWSWDARNPKLRLTQLVMTEAGDTWLGSADMQDNGQLVLRVSDGARQIQASGALLRGDPLRPFDDTRR